MIDHSSEIIDVFISAKAKRYGFSFEVSKLAYRCMFDCGMLDVHEFAKDAGVSEDAVRRYFGGEPASEPEEADETDNDDETEATAQDAAQLLSQQIDLLERDSNSILERADRDYNNAAAYSDDRLLDQLYALNRQLSILTRMFAIHARNTLKERED